MENITKEQAEKEVRNALSQLNLKLGEHEFLQECVTKLKGEKDDNN